MGKNKEKIEILEKKIKKLKAENVKLKTSNETIKKRLRKLVPDCGHYYPPNIEACKNCNSTVCEDCEMSCDHCIPCVVYCKKCAKDFGVIDLKDKRGFLLSCCLEHKKLYD